MSSLVQKMPGLRWRKGSKPRKPLRIPSASLVMTVLGAMLLTLFLGAVVALGAIKLTIGLAGLLASVPILFLVNTRLMLPVLFVSVFVVQGTVEYFFHMRMATWMASAFCALFFVRAVLELTSRERSSAIAARVFPSAGAIVVTGTVYLLCYFYSLVVSHPSMLQTISAVRFCVPMFGVLFALYWFDWEERRLSQLWMMIVAIQLLQLPFSLYQHLFLITVSGWDGVSGTFGFGMSALLALFSLSTLMYVLARWSRGLTKLRVVLAVAFVTLVVILLGEVKAILFWLPLGVFWVMRHRVLRNVIALAMFACLSVAFMGGTYTAYKTMYWGAAHGKDDTLSEKLNSISAYVVDPNNISYKTGEISRAASLVLWYRDPLGTGMQRLIGYGPGASAITSFGRGVVAERYRPLGIAATAMAKLLWEVGIVGTAAYLSFIILPIIAGYRFVRRGTATPAMIAAVDTSTGVLALLMSTLVYNRAMIDEPTVQLLCFFCIGTIVQCCRYHNGTARATKPAAGDARNFPLHGVRAT